MSAAVKIMKRLAIVSTVVVALSLVYWAGMIRGSGIGVEATFDAMRDAGMLEGEAKGDGRSYIDGYEKGAFDASAIWERELDKRFPKPKEQG